MLDGEITALYLVSGEDKYYVNYYPGDLIFNEVVWAKIQSDTLKKFHLRFTYNNFKKNKQETKDFDIELNTELFKQPYLIVNIYDFRDKRYRKWYQYLTKENYLVEINCPNCAHKARME